MQIIKEKLPASALGFGIHFCPKMLVSRYKNKNWSNPEIVVTEALSLHPAAKVLHYGQEIFEGLKAYKTENGRISLFRPQANIHRMSYSAEVISMPKFPEDIFLECLKKITRESSSFAPEAPGSLYLRPTMIATTATLGVQPADEFLLYILVSPVGGYFGTAHADKPVQVDVLATSEFVRAVRGGIGSAKTGGNYAASLRAIQNAKNQGYNNVLFLDAIHKKYLEELGGMNVFAVFRDELHTPKLTDSILAGVTRDSILQISKRQGIKTVERDIPIDEILQGLQNGDLKEMFACGTAAVVTSIKNLGWQGEKRLIANGQIGPLTARLFKELTDIHYGRKKPDFDDWMIDI